MSAVMRSRYPASVIAAPPTRTPSNLRPCVFRKASNSASISLGVKISNAPPLKPDAYKSSAFDPLAATFALSFSRECR